MTVFHQYAQYYDLLYADKNYEQEASYVDGLLKKHSSLATRILEFGCGTGKHAALLVDKGYFVHGVDMSADMIVLAQQRSMSNEAVFSCDDIRSVNLNKTFDVVISLFHVMSYQVTNEDLDAAFSRAAKHLSLGGLFVFDVWYGSAVLTEKPTVRVKRVENDQIKVVRIAEPVLHAERNCVEVNFTVFFETKKTGKIETFFEQHIMRYLFVPEIAALCSHHNFDLVLYEEWLTELKPTTSSWSVCFVCKKR